MYIRVKANIIVQAADFASALKKVEEKLNDRNGSCYVENVEKVEPKDKRG